MLKETLTIRKPSIHDGPRIWALVRQCPPLDLNSPYLYLLLSHHFSGTCLIAESEGDMVGFVSAYRPPEEKDTLFIWQIAVADRARGHGLGKELLLRLVRDNATPAIRNITCTVSPSNTASRRLFESAAQELKSTLKTSPLFTEQHFPPGTQHEEEVLFTIGPINEHRR